MSCNPAVGGIAKGQIVREIDALGGQMGLVTDETAIQFRILNRSKGPAMWSPRAQCDRAKFIWSWREKLENTPNLHIWQDTVCELLVENGEVTGLVTAWGVTFKAKCIVLTAGTFLNGLMHVGRHQLPGGRMAEQELIDKNVFQEINIGDDTDRSITKPFCCDLLSIAMGRAPAGCAWVTVMGNLNTLAVAALADAACVILAEGAMLDEAAVKKAALQGITVLRTEETVFETALAVKELLK